MSPELEQDIRDFLLRCIREHEEEWLAIEAESLLKRMKEEIVQEAKSRAATRARILGLCVKCDRKRDNARDFCPHCGETYEPNVGSDPEHRWPY